MNAIYCNVVFIDDERHERQIELGFEGLLHPMTRMSWVDTVVESVWPPIERTEYNRLLTKVVSRPTNEEMVK